jgi:hypothetical protein
VRQHLTEIPIGIQGIGIDHLEREAKSAQGTCRPRGRGSWGLSPPRYSRSARSRSRLPTAPRRGSPRRSDHRQGRAGGGQRATLFVPEWLAKDKGLI